MRAASRKTKTSPLKSKPVNYSALITRDLPQLFILIGKPILRLLFTLTYFSLISLHFIYSIAQSFFTIILLILKSIHKPNLKFPQITVFNKPLKNQPLNLNRRYIYLRPHFPLRKIIFIFTFSTIISLIGATALFLYQYIFTNLPDINKLITDNRQPTTSNFYDRHGRLLYQIYQDQNRQPINTQYLPPYVIQAHLAIEDQNFYQHIGINLPDILRASYQNIKNYLKCQLTTTNCQLNIQGASTITQQLVKNTLLSPEKTFHRKLQEAILAIQLERQLTKDQILEKYLNTVSYGGTAYGIEAAARKYFAKPASELNLAEAALLAGLPAAPTTYSPFGAHPELATTRQQHILDRMCELGYISETVKLETKNWKLTYAAPDQQIKAPHFVMYLRQQLEEEYGPQYLTQNNLNIITSLDLDLQEYSQSILESEILNLESLNVSNGAILITKPATGEILAMVGSINYFDLENQGNVNATTALRQPGSAIKPINYATALALRGLSEGASLPIYTPATLINDSPVTFNFPNQSPYSPTNYDSQFHGRVTLRTALASSYNVPAVKVLYSYGIGKMLNMGKQLGITTWGDPQKYGLSLTLGGGEVKMTDLAVAYGSFANLGYRVELNPILKIASPINRVLDNLTIQQFNNSPILDPGVAFLINHILSDENARIPGFGHYSLLTIKDHSVAVKTGTSNNLRDNWAIGYTPDYLVAVWVGNFDNSPMARVASGITGATPIWHQIMTYLLDQYHPTLPDSIIGPIVPASFYLYAQLSTLNDNHQNPLLNQANSVPDANEAKSDFPPVRRSIDEGGWPIPPGLIKLPICPYANSLTCSGCPAKEEWFIQGTQPTKNCSGFSPTPTLNDVPNGTSPKPTPQPTSTFSPQLQPTNLPSTNKNKPKPPKPQDLYQKQQQHLQNLINKLKSRRNETLIQ